MGASATAVANAAAAAAVAVAQNVAISGTNATAITVKIVALNPTNTGLRFCSTNSTTGCIASHVAINTDTSASIAGCTRFVRLLTKMRNGLLLSLISCMNSRNRPIAGITTSLVNANSASCAGSSADVNSDQSTGKMSPRLRN